METSVSASVPPEIVVPFPFPLPLKKFRFADFRFCFHIFIPLPFFREKIGKFPLYFHSYLAPFPLEGMISSSIK
jgi:hypothetical protein